MQQINAETVKRPQITRLAVTRLAVTRLAVTGLVVCAAGAVTAEAVTRGSRPLGPAYVLVPGALLPELVYLFQQGMVTAALFWLGGHLTEARTTLSFGSEQLDAANIVLNDPDATNVVWISRRYSERGQAEAVAAAIEGRLRQSAER